MKYDFDKIIDRHNTGCVKWDLNEELFGRKDVLSMWVADMDMEAPPEVTDALRKRVEHAAYGYTFGTDSLKEAVSVWEQNRHGWKIDSEWIMFCPGIVPAINFLIKCFTQENDGIIVQTPVYYPFMNSVSLNGRRLVNNQLKETEKDYEIDFGLLEEQASDPSVKMMLISSPHNPAGKVFSKDELEKMGSICRRNGVLLISDEIHQDVVYPPFEHVCTSSISEEISENTVTCIAPSKTFNLAGLAFSAIIIPDEKIREKFKRYMSTTGIHGCNLMGYTAGEAAYRHGQKWLDELLRYLMKNIDTMDDFLKNELPGIKMQRPQSTYLAWLDFREYGLSQKVLVDKIINEAGLGLNDGSSFGPGGEGFMRLNFACPNSIVIEALERLKKAFG